jgi:H+/Cl- antiporter ClcA
MERRFTRAWHDLEERAENGGGLPRALSRTRTPDLVAALAGASKEDPVAANVIATELLNRTRRAPYMGACFVSVLVVFMTFIFELVYTGSFAFDEAHRRAWSIIILSATAAFFSFALYKRWLHLPHRLRAVLEERERNY